MLRTAEWALLFLGYSGTGVLLLRSPFGRWNGGAVSAEAVLLGRAASFLSLGVYQASSAAERLGQGTGHSKTWQRPYAAGHLSSRPVVFAALPALYKAVDIWVDSSPSGFRDQEGPTEAFEQKPSSTADPGSPRGLQLNVQRTSSAGGADSDLKPQQRMTVFRKLN
jgi:hypothetical protein